MFKKKKIWMNVHLYLSLFFLPAALLYAITGSLYLFGIKEEAGATIHEIKIQPLPKGKEQETILQILKENNLKIPSNTTLKMARGNPSMGSIRYNITVTKAKDGSTVLRTIERGLYGILLLMHKGKGGFYFDIIAVSFSVSLLLFYFSGLIITTFCKNKRKSALLAFFGGLVITGFMIFLSI
ncbi:hypothetical protein [Helicobacter trogontum]|uniref:Membrane protein n=1 Tax=Helicobacter trogontum TaxID=50960 RepID=A0A4U8TEK5_9HELI|nr:hypothetical protein [Helicobacter trogontum]MCI5786619.1 hypothetical protein [Helicobacter trogontum]MDY5184636.1 hypothetical protein [Helicobacter trogontum]TLD97127.1 hypothetical protein LS80_007080 [Helicobacter trogontum]